MIFELPHNTSCKMLYICLSLKPFSFKDDIDMACGEEDSDFKPILKPYQLVGVNFLLLLYRKKIGGGTSSL